MGRYLFISSLVILSFTYVTSEASTLPPHRFSQARKPLDDFRKYIRHSLTLLSGKELTQITQGTSAVDVAVTPDKLDLSKVDTAYSASDALGAFTKGRDLRFLQSDDNPGFLRRSTWLFPDDGCWARAALLSQHFQTWRLKRPVKVFVFGNLVVKTPNAPGNSISWWYHVVDAATVNGKTTVFDPAIEPRKPLLLKDWLFAMVPDLSQIRVSICRTESYSPFSGCSSPEPAEEIMATADQTVFLPYEWARISELGRDPQQELGDNPPWMKGIGFLFN